MKRILWAATVTVVIVTLIPFHVAGQGKKERDRVVAEMMQKKLKSAQSVLEGIAKADFKKISANADELISLAKSETWQLIRSPRYEVFSNEFIRAAENLAQKARDKNVDGAALAYVELTLTCVRCHQFVRDLRDARLDPESPSASGPSAGTP